MHRSILILITGVLVTLCSSQVFAVSTENFMGCYHLVSIDAKVVAMDICLTEIDGQTKLGMFAGSRLIPSIILAEWKYIDTHVALLELEGNMHLKIEFLKNVQKQNGKINIDDFSYVFEAAKPLSEVKLMLQMDRLLKQKK